MEAISKEVLRGIGKMARLKQQTRKWGGGGNEIFGIFLLLK